MKNRILFIINPIAGGRNRGERIRRLVESILNTSRADIAYDMQVTSAQGDANRMAKAAADGEYDIVAAVGGDGTMNEVASGLVGSNTALGIVPIGSGNGLARGLDVPLASRQAILAICNGVRHAMDVGVMGKKYFFSTSGFGFDAMIGKLFNEGSFRGPLPYFYFAFREFFRYKPVEYRIRFDDRDIQIEALMVTVANTNQFGNGAIIAPFAKPDDGLLDICVLRHMNALRAFRQLPKLFSGQLQKSADYDYYQVESALIERPEPAPIHIDGEPLHGEAAMAVKILPRQLYVMMPETYD